jgi:hypothetical protein
MICHPTNFWTASARLGSQRTSEDILTESVEGLEDVSPNQIFALCLEAYSDEICAVTMAVFNEKVTSKLNKHNELLIQNNIKAKK